MASSLIRFTREARASSLTVSGVLNTEDGRRLCHTIDISIEQLAASLDGRDAEIARAEREIKNVISQHR